MSEELKLHAIRQCLEGVIPGMLATSALDGTPNVAFLSQVEYIDDAHVALSYQFFNKTRQNILANPYGTLLVTDPRTGARYRLSLKYLRTESEGPLFERMKAKLAGIASHTGMTGIFRLLGSDIYELQGIEAVPGKSLPPPPPRRNLLSALRRSSERLNACGDLELVLSETLSILKDSFEINHTMLLMLDRKAGRLYTVASSGYDRSGVGSEIAVGDGVIGVAAREAAPIRIGHMTSEYSYSRAIRESAKRGGLSEMLDTEIPLPGLAESRSQMAVPITSCGNVLGILFVESPEDLRFTYDDEDALVAVAAQLGTTIHALQQAAESSPGNELKPRKSIEASGAPVQVRHYPQDDSIFLNGEYLIKGVAGSIFWALVRDYVQQGRTEFSNRELRLDTRIQLPDISDNLEARLILLQRRLEERDQFIRIEKTGRGRFQLLVSHPLQLAEMAAAAAE